MGSVLNAVLGTGCWAVGLLGERERPFQSQTLQGDWTVRLDLNLSVLPSRDEHNNESVIDTGHLDSSSPYEPTNMEQIETQVSDLRSFLPGDLPPAAATVAAVTASSSRSNSSPAAAESAAIPIGMAGGSGAMGIGPGAALTSTPRHPSQSAGSPLSAVGSNSAHPSPLSYNTNYQHDAAQPTSRGFRSSSLSAGAAVPLVSSSGPAAAAGAGAKRKQDGGAEDASQKQQRSKRNRVSPPYRARAFANGV